MTLESANLQIHQNDMLALAEEYDPNLVERLGRNNTSVYMLLDKEAQNVACRIPVLPWVDMYNELEQLLTPQGLAKFKKPLGTSGPGGKRMWDHLFRYTTEMPQGSDSQKSGQKPAVP